MCSETARSWTPWEFVRWMGRESMEGERRRSTPSERECTQRMFGPAARMGSTSWKPHMAMASASATWGMASFGDL